MVIGAENWGLYNPDQAQHPHYQQVHIRESAGYKPNTRILFDPKTKGPPEKNFLLPAIIYYLSCHVYFRHQQVVVFFHLSLHIYK